MAIDGGLSDRAEAGDTSRWARVCAIFDVATELPREAWERVVTREAAGDASLHEEVMRILTAEDEDRFRLDCPRLVVRTTAEHALAGSDRTGQTIARYRLVRLIGCGGMGTVYEGVRADDAYQQRVAVKLLRPELVASSMTERFRRERQILAALQHRNVAHLIDGGVTESGEPFFVMEYVDGTPITKYCDEHHLTVAERLRLFLQACSAVQHAHGRLVVHRDIKPGNILVTPDGSVKLLDFGVAKLLGAQDGGDGMATITQLGQPLTPEYASPEQLRHEPASAASDVYSLGVVLYEILAGKRPFDVATRSPLAVLRALEHEPPRPSAAVSAVAAEHAGEPNTRRLRRQLAGELDNIVRMAMHGELVRRYGSVEQFAGDIRRYLDGRPVMAQPESATYRMRKFTLRHLGGVTAAVFAVLALVVGAGAATVQARRAESARVTAERTSTFLQDILSAPDSRWYRAGRANVRVADVLDGAAARADTAFVNEPASEAMVRRTIGLTYDALARYDDAERQLRAALAIDKRIGSPSFPDQANDFRELGIVRYHKGDLHGAEALDRVAVSLCNGRAADTAGICFGAVNNLGVALLLQGSVPAAEPYFTDALRRARLRSKNNAPGIALILGNIGSTHLQRGDFRGAEPWFRQQLAIHAQAMARGRELSERPIPLMNLSTVLLLQGRLAEAESAAAESRRSVLRTGGVPESPRIVAVSWANSAEAFRRRGELAQADTAISHALEIVHAKAPPPSLYIAQVEAEQGRLLIAEGRPADAERVLQHALLIWSPPLATADPRIAHIATALGSALALEGKRNEALPLLTQSAAALGRAYGSAHPWTVEATMALRTLR